jgi:gamma-glutamyl-gamma-aminobutyrate hydrolase PuuD
VQWHPEALTADRALHHRIFFAFILACKRRQGRG